MLKGGAVLIGKRISQILSETNRTKTLLNEILNEEIKLEEESRLINEILESNRSLGYDEVRDSLKNILKELQK